MIDNAVMVVVFTAIISNAVVVLLALSRWYDKLVKRLAWTDLALVYLLKNCDSTGDDVAKHILSMTKSFNPRYKAHSLIQDFCVSKESNKNACRKNHN